MKIGLIDVDNYQRLEHCYPNLALMKISAHHKAWGDEVQWYDGSHCDIVYCSKVFSFTPDYPFPINADHIEKGGTGYAIHLEDGREIMGEHHDLPYDVEHTYPDYSLYGITDTAYGFLSRGCPRGCSFCHVAAKEGQRSRKVADLCEFWSGQPNIVLMDPNILACRERMELLDQIIESGALIDFNQGIDIRLVTVDIAKKFSQIRVKSIHFAYDRYQDKAMIEPKFRAFHELSGWDRHKINVYVLCNFDTTLEQDLDRVMFLRSVDMSPYIMRYDKEHIKRGSMVNKLARWVNNRAFFWKYPTFEDYLIADKNGETRPPYKKGGPTWLTENPGVRD